MRWQPYTWTSASHTINREESPAFLAACFQPQFVTCLPHTRCACKVLLFLATACMPLQKLSLSTLRVLRRTPVRKTPGANAHLARGQLPQNHAEAGAHTHAGQCRSVLELRALHSCQAAYRYTSSRSTSQICKTTPVLRRVGRIARCEWLTTYSDHATSPPLCGAECTDVDICSMK